MLVHPYLCGRSDLQTTLECRDTVGTMSRSVEDIILFDDIFSDCLPKARPAVPSMQGLRLGLPRQWWEGLDPQVRVLQLNT